MLFIYGLAEYKLVVLLFIFIGYRLDLVILSVIIGWIAWSTSHVQETTELWQGDGGKDYDSKKDGC